MEFRILGPLEVLEGDLPVPLPGPRQRSLLALLLLHANEVVSSDRLVDELWTHEDPESGSAALQASVSRLRKALGGGSELLATVAARLRPARRPRPAGPASLRGPRRRGGRCGSCGRLQMRSATHSLSGAALRSRSLRMSGSPRRRSAGWTSFASWRSRSESMPTSRSAATATSSRSSRRWFPSILCGRACAPSSCWPSTAAAGRPMHWRRFRQRAARSSSSSASSQGPRSMRWRRPSCATIRLWTSRSPSGHVARSSSQASMLRRSTRCWRWQSHLPKSLRER